MSNKNTLFAYFKKVDDGSKKNGIEKTPKPTPPTNGVTSKPTTPKNVSSNKKKKSSPKSSSEKKPAAAKKRRRIIEEPEDDDEDDAPEKKVSKKRDISDGSDASEDEWKPNEKVAAEESSSEEEGDSEHSVSELDSDSDHSVVEEKKQAPSRKKKSAGPVTKQEKEPHGSGAALIERNWLHLNLDFLKPDKIRDADKRRPDHPDYNPRTLYVPQDFQKKMTPAMKQWWEVKSKNFDCVIFLKLGKFYELYHMDATIGVNELSLIYMKHPEVAHSGFPEAGYARYAKVLVEKGYKVARVEQTETPEMMQNRCKKMSAPTKYDKVVKREVCQITSKGTRTYMAIEGEATSSENAYLLSITEQKGENGSVYGICFVDTSLGSFCLGQFQDDRHKSELRTLLAHYPPAHVLLHRTTLSEETKTIVTNMSNSALIETLANEVEFLTAAKALKMVHEKNYFGIKDENEKTEWPEILVQATEGQDLRTPDANSELSLSAFGACLWYLENCKLDMQMMCTKNFTLYSSQSLGAATPAAAKLPASNMVLDSTTLSNLDVVFNSETGLMENTLLGKIDYCSTPFGKRLLRQWLCAPLCSVESIKLRQDAVSALMQMPSECEKARKLLKELPDIERLLLKVAVYGSASTAANHPDSRAIFYEDFSKKKIESLLALLKGFKDSLKVIKIFKDCDGDADLLKRISCTKEQNEKGQYPELQSLLDFFENAFDPQEALSTGKLTPRKGVDPEFEAFQEKFQEIDSELKQHLREMRKIFGCDVKYFGTDKKRYQIEVPVNAATRAPSSFEFTSSKKGFKRFYSPEGKALLAKMLVAEEEKKGHLLDINRRMFARFASSSETWMTAMKCLGILDVLLSFAKYGAGEATCMPQVKSPTEDKPCYINIKEGRLPTTTLTDFIPNDTVVGLNDVHLLLLSGPNMGGKSTLMRQLGLIVIMAQIGCPVPAESCEMTPVDRIFTRIGAQDHILAGESTFFVEMSETASILKHATQHSIVLVDELGRGTTTFDGAAIASAVLESLILKKCSTIFSTHYHFLVEKYENCRNVDLVHMACMEEADESGESEGEAKVENVTFLYKLTPGACPSSHGFNAARLAGLPINLVRKAKHQALKLQSYPKKVEIFQKLMQTDQDDLKSLVKMFNSISKWST